MSTPSPFFSPTMGFLLTVGFGFWLSKLGRPYHGVLFNVHKLVALGTIILIAVRTYGLWKPEPQPAIIICLILAVFGVIALFVSGAFLSIGNMQYAVVKMIHNIAPVISVLAMGFVIYFLSAGS